MAFSHPRGQTLINRNLNFEHINVTFKAAGEDNLICGHGTRRVDVQENEYTITGSTDGRDMINIPSFKHNYRADSSSISLLYYYDIIYPNSTIELRTILSVCKNFDYPSLSVVVALLTVASICGLAFIGMTYFKFENIRNLPGKCLLNMSLSMATGLTIWLFLSKNDNKIICSAAAITGHYFWLGTFFWMSVVGFDTWWTFRPNAMRSDASSQTSLFYGYSFFAWGMPLVIVSAGVFVTYGVPRLRFVYGGKHACWLLNPVQLISTFLLPVGCVCLSNLLFFFDTIVNICRVRKQIKLATPSHNIYRDFIPFLKIPVLLGVSWLLGFLGPIFNEDILWITFEVVNASQGILLFLVFISTRRIRVLYGFAKSLNKSDRQTSTSATSK